MAACTFHDTEPTLLDHKLFEIVEKAYNQQKRVVIFAQTDQRAAAIDRVLWIHKQECFIPHEIVAADSSESPVPVAIVTAEVNPIAAATLVADGHCHLDFALSFEEIHEFVNRSSPHVHAACRDRFRGYREKHVPIQHVK
jgi:DNA polymerase IIIc chi subunit